MTDATPLERTLSNLKSVVEIAAILIGGWWTYDKFIRTEEPSLAPHFQVASDLVWHKLPGSSNCIAEVKVSVQNKAKSTIEIKAVQRIAWIVAREPETQGISYFDAMESTHTTPFDKKRYNKGPLAQRYPPESSSHHTFTWFVHKRPGTYSLFRIDLYRQPDDTESFDYVYEWGPTCDSVVTPSKPQSAKKPK
jgi:hypothetical protein